MHIFWLMRKVLKVSRYCLTSKKESDWVRNQNRPVSSKILNNQTNRHSFRIYTGAYPVGGIGANASLKPENVTSFTMNLYDSENKISKSNPIKSLTCGKMSVTLRHWLWCTVFIYSRLSLLNCNKIRAGDVPYFMGGPASCLMNICFAWVNSWLERRECFHINRYITVANLFSISQWLW